MCQNCVNKADKMFQNDKKERRMKPNCANYKKQRNKTAKVQTSRIKKRKIPKSNAFTFFAVSVKFKMDTALHSSEQMYLQYLVVSLAELH